MRDVRGLCSNIRGSTSSSVGGKLRYPSMSWLSPVLIQVESEREVLHKIVDVVVEMESSTNVLLFQDTKLSRPFNPMTTPLCGAPDTYKIV
jgi:hypothetical protein